MPLIAPLPIPLIIYGPYIVASFVTLNDSTNTFPALAISSVYVEESLNVEAPGIAAVIGRYILPFVAGPRFLLVLNERTTADCGPVQKEPAVPAMGVSKS